MAGLSEAQGWLFGRRTDLWAFGGSAAASLALLALGAPLGLLEADAPEWVWLSCVLAVDVAHVWSTCFRVYFDGAELRRRPGLYLVAPAAALACATALHAASPALFWRALAYVAVFHFVRQQVGWVALYGHRAPGYTALDRRLDRLTVYVATLGPLLHWHARLPTRFSWFMAGDFIRGLPMGWVEALSPLYWGVLLAFAARQAVLGARGQLQPGKLLLVGSTALCWYLGIVAFDSDYAFTVTNVLIHGVPYLVLTYRYAARHRDPTRPSLAARIVAGGGAAFLVTCLALAWGEELLWDRLVWHDRPWLFGAGAALPQGWLALLVPLLALPQLTHYLLDAYIWRVRSGALSPASL